MKRSGSRLAKALVKSGYFSLLGDCIPNDHFRQVSSIYYAGNALDRNGDMCRVLDLGCGKGDSIDYFQSKREEICWVGLDIAASPEVMARTRRDARFCAFDGKTIPFARDSFDLVYSHQVFEHVRYPSVLLKEVCRVLRPSGCFVGSTSHLEPYHSYSLWNYTPFGFRTLLEESGLRLVEIRPGVDAFTLIIRRGLRGSRIISWGLTRESFFNRVLNLIGRMYLGEPAMINALKLLFCGQFAFLAQI